MALAPLYFEYETTDGLQPPVRVFAADRIAAERSARANGWKYEDTPQIHALMGFHAVKRNSGLGDEHPSFDAWFDRLVDFMMSNTIDEDDEKDPTQAA